MVPGERWRKFGLSLLNFGGSAGDTPLASLNLAVPRRASIINTAKAIRRLPAIFDGKAEIFLLLRKIAH